MAAKWLKARQTRYGAYATVYTLVVLAILAAVNFLVQRYDQSFDATKNKQYSLSDQTIKIVKGLKNDVRMIYFGESGSFPNARDLLERYSSLSTRLRVDYIDPNKKPTLAKAAGFRSDSPVVVENGARHEGAKSLTEEEITGALIRALKSGERNVCFLTGAGEHSIDDQDREGFGILKALLEHDNYKSRAVSLKPEAAAPDAGKKVEIGQAAPSAALEVPKDCTVLVSGGPTADYPAPVVAAIKSYVEDGGRAYFMFDNVLRIGRTEPAAPNDELAKLLESWGVTVNKDLVLDLGGLGQIFGFGPEIPVVLQYESHPITQPLSRIPTAFPLTRSLEIKSEGKTSVSKLVATSEDSLGTSEIGPGGQVDPKKGKKGPLTLVAAGTYSGTKQGRFVVTGTSIWAVNSLAGSRQLGNRELFMNSINWLASDEDLISIRPKMPEDQPLNLGGQRMAMLFWLSIVIFPLTVVAFGLATWWKRR
ncbi:MAG: GldG family protein [Bryobacteraceae bacterium]